MEIQKLKCGCSVTEQGTWVFGEDCSQRNCGECRLIASMHPFARERLADLLYPNVKKLY